MAALTNTNTGPPGAGQPSTAWPGHPQPGEDAACPDVTAAVASQRAARRSQQRTADADPAPVAITPGADAEPIAGTIAEQPPATSNRRAAAGSAGMHPRPAAATPPAQPPSQPQQVTTGATAPALPRERRVDVPPARNVGSSAAGGSSVAPSVPAGVHGHMRTQPQFIADGFPVPHAAPALAPPSTRQPSGGPRVDGRLELGGYSRTGMPREAIPNPPPALPRAAPAVAAAATAATAAAAATGAARQTNGGAQPGAPAAQRVAAAAAVAPLSTWPPRPHATHAAASEAAQASTAPTSAAPGMAALRASALATPPVTVPTTADPAAPRWPLHLSPHDAATTAPAMQSPQQPPPQQQPAQPQPPRTQHRDQQMCATPEPLPTTLCSVQLIYPMTNAHACHTCITRRSPWWTGAATHRRV